MVDHTLNISPNKTTFSFSKATRFPSLGNQHHTINISPNTLDKKTDFDHTVEKAVARGNQGFGVRDRRFTYCPNIKDKKSGKQSPGNYKIQGSLSPQKHPYSGYKQTSQYTFGNGRNSMKPCFIDEVMIRERKTEMVGPAKYTDTKSFGRTGTHFSFLSRQYKSGARNGKFDLTFQNTERERPGPGQYNKQDTVGQPKHGQSDFETAPRFGFSTSQKFFTPTVKEKGPAPDNYSPRSALGMDNISKNKRTQGVKFGKDMTDALEVQYAMKEQRMLPGPGNYERYSEFNPKYYKDNNDF